MRIGHSTIGIRSDLPDPTKARDRTATYKAYVQGPALRGGMSYADVRQGYLNDCFAPSAYAGLAKHMRDELRQALRREPDGSYVVTFKEVHRNGDITEVEVPVDADFYLRRKDGSAHYMKVAHQNGAVELWPALLEKALAIYESEERGEKPSYQALNDGGMASRVMSLVTGRKPYLRSISSGAMLWREVTRAVDEGRAASLGSGEDGRRFRRTGIVSDHSYAVLGYRERNGTREIQLYNPWGDTEPTGNGANDGVFWVKLDLALKAYTSFESIV